MSTPAPADARIELRQTLWFFGGFALLAVLLIVLYGGFTRTTATALAWALACSISGAAVGFLFGVPKVLQAPPSGEGEGDARVAAYRQQVNTNLTEISDWLTKIIVGLGLINLKEVPVLTASTAAVLAAGLGGAPSAMAFAYGIITTTTITGFLFGYLSTRLFLSGAFSRADIEASNIARAAAAERDTNVDRLQVQFGLLATEIRQTAAGIPGGQGDEGDGRDLTDPAGATPESPSRVKGPSIGELWPGDKSVDGLALLRQKAREYLAVDDPNRSARIRAKDELGAEMALLARIYELPRDVIARDAQAGPGAAVADGLILTLATLSIDQPQSGDLRRLLEVGPLARWKHVRYRVVTALAVLADRAKEQEKMEIDQLLDRYEHDADEALKHNIQRTRQLLDPDSRW